MLAGLLLTSSAYGEHNARVAAPFHQLVRVGIVEAPVASQTKDGRNAQLVSGASFLHAVFNGEWD